MSRYPKLEYSHTRKQSTAAALIRAQGEQIRRRKAECAALDKLYCRDGECRFYKYKEPVKGARE